MPQAHYFSISTFGNGISEKKSARAMLSFVVGPKAVRQAVGEARRAARGEEPDHLFRRGLHQYQLSARRLPRHRHRQGTYLYIYICIYEHVIRRTCFQWHSHSRIHSLFFSFTHTHTLPRGARARLPRASDCVVEKLFVYHPRGIIRGGWDILASRVAMCRRPLSLD